MAVDVPELAIYDDAGAVVNLFPLLKDKPDATAAPAVGNDNTQGYNIGSHWADRTNKKVYVCTDNTTGAAVWKELGSAGGGAGAPATADYLVKTADGVLTAERVVTDSGFIAADWSVAGQVAFGIVNDSITIAKLHADLKDNDATLAANSPTRLATQQAVKGYVDNLLDGLAWKMPVRAIATTDGALATAYENGDTVDGVVLSTGDRIALAGQTAATENGLYLVQASGAPVRSNDASTGSELAMSAFYVKEGTAGADTQWVVTNNTITLGTDNIVIAQRTGAGTYVADGVTLELVGNSFRIKTAGVTYAKIQDVSALSVLCRSADTSGVVGELTAGAVWQVLHRVGSNLVFALLDGSASLLDDSINNAKLENMAAARIKGRITAGLGDPEDLTGTQATTLLDLFTTALKGLVPASGGGTTNFLRADGTFAAPPGTGVSAGVLASIQVLTSGTTYTRPAGINAILVCGEAAGGGSGGVAGAASSIGVSAGAGGGSYFEKLIISPASTYPYTIGAAGAGGASGNNPGTAGGNTTWDTGGDLITAFGGALTVGGAATTVAAYFTGGAGGATPTGPVTWGRPGYNGEPAHRHSGTVGKSGQGGNSRFGSGGIALVASSIGVDGFGKGSGAGGACSTSATARAGGAGAGGIIVAYEFK